MSGTGQETAGAREAGVNWNAAAAAAVPWAVVLSALTALAHQFDLQTVCARFAEAPSRATLPPSGLWMIATAAGGAGLVAAIPRTLPRRLAAGGAALAAVLILGLLPPPLLAVGFLAPLVAFAMAARSRIQGEPVHMDLVAGGLLVLILSYAASTRYEALLAALPRPLDPDADGYLKIAEQHRGWSTQFREPLYIWILQIGHLLGGAYGGAFLRLVGVGTSLLSIGVVFALCWRWIGKAAAVVAAGLYASRPVMVGTAAQGLREDVVIATTFLFLLACLNVWGKAPSWRGYAALGLAGAAAVLLRLSSLNFVTVLTVVTVGVALWKRRPPLKRSAPALVPFVLLAVLVMPYLAHCGKLYGDPFFAVNFAFRYYANVELAGKHPDMPTPEQVAADGYAGPPITAGEYLFKYHTVPQLASGIFQGMKRLGFGDLVEMAFRSRGQARVHPVIYVFHLAGLAALLLPGRRFILAGLVWFHAPLFFLASFRWFDPRLLTVAFVGYYVGVGAAATTAIALVRRLLAAREAEEPAPARSARRKVHKAERQKRAGVKSEG